MNTIMVIFMLFSIVMVMVCIICHGDGMFLLFSLRIIVVGGDGTFMHVVNAVLKRLMQESGRNMDDADGELIKTQLTLGILPGGLYN